MAPRDVDKVEERLDSKVSQLATDFNNFRVEVAQRLTKLETIIAIAFGGNSIATIVLFILK